MFAFGSASDWVLRRLLKVILKRNLANFIATEIDVQQLGIQLDKGSLELKECLLDATQLNESLASNEDFEFESVLIGRICVTLFPPAIILEDAVVSMRQRSSQKGPAATWTTAAAPPQSSLSSTATFNTHDAAIGEGVKVISKSLKNLLGSIRVESKRLAAQLELRSGHVITLNVDTALLANQTAPPNVPSDEIFSESTRMFTFDGVAFQISSPSKDKDTIRTGDGDKAIDDGGENRTTLHEVVVARISSHQGCHGKVLFDWIHNGGGNDDDDFRTNEEPNSTLCIQAELCGFHMKTYPQVLTPILQLVDIWFTKKAHSSPSMTETKVASPATIRASHLDAESLVKALMLPDGEHILEEHFSSHADDKHHPDDTPEKDVDEFFDAVSEIMSQSIFSTTRSLVSSFMSDAKAKQEGVFDEEGEEYTNSVEFDLRLPSCSLSLVYARLPLEEESSRIQVSCSGVCMNVETNTSRSHFAITFDTLHVAEQRWESTSQRSLANCAAILSSLQDNSMHGMQDERSFKHTIAKLDDLRTDECSNPECDSRNMMVILEILHRNDSSALRISIASNGDRISVTTLSQEVMVALDIRLINVIRETAETIIDQLSHQIRSPMPDKIALTTEVFYYAPAISLIAFNSPIPPLVIRTSITDVDQTLIRSAIRKDNKISDMHQLLPTLYFCSCEEKRITLAFDGLKVFAIHSSDCDFPPQPEEIVSATDLRIITMKSTDFIASDCFEQFQDIMSQIKSEIPCREISIRGSIVFSISWNMYNILQAAIPSIHASAPKTAADRLLPMSSTVLIEHVSVQLSDHSVNEFLSIDVSSAEINRLSASEIAISICSIQSLSVSCNDVHCLQVRPKARAIVITVADIDLPDTCTPLQVDVSVSGFSMKGELAGRSNHIVGKILRWVPAHPHEMNGNTSVNRGVELSVHAMDCLFVHSSSGSVDTNSSIAVCLEDIRFVRDPSSAMHAIISNIGVYISDREDVSLCDESFPKMLQDRNYCIFASEQVLECDTSLFESDAKCWKQSHLTTNDLRISLNKRSAMQVKLALEQLKRVSNSTMENSTHDISGGSLKAEITDAIEAEILSNASDYEAIPEPCSDSHTVGIVDQIEFFNSKAVAGADGAWFGSASLSEVLVTEHVRKAVSDSFVSSDRIPTSEFILTLGKASVTLTDSLYVMGLSSRVEGEVKLVADGATVRVFTYDCNHRKASFGLNSMALRHSLDSVWSESLVMPYKDVRLPAFDIISSAARDADWIVNAKIAPAMVRVDQILLLFLNEFFSVSNIDAWQDVDDVEEKNKEEEADVGILVQRCRVEEFPLHFSYKPWTVDAQAIRSGSIMELVNCLPELRAKLQLRNLLLRGPISMQVLLTRAAFCWLEDVKHQLPSFVPGAGSFMAAAEALRKTLAMMRQILQK